MAHETRWRCFSLTCTKSHEISSEELWAFLAAWDVCGVDEKETDEEHCWNIYLPENPDAALFEQELKRWLARSHRLDQDIRISNKIIERENWNENWKQFFRPIHVAPHYLICPPWEQITLPETPSVQLVIEPGMAFGTGTHPTTQLCLTLLSSYVHAGTSVLDVGTGSGILCIAATKLGARWCLGVDNDLLVIENASQNLKLNEITAERVSIAVADLRAFRDRTFDLILCNMLPQNLVPLLPSLRRFASDSTTTILTGFLESERLEFERTVNEVGFDVILRESLHEWGGCVVRLQ